MKRVVIPSGDPALEARRNAGLVGGDVVDAIAGGRRTYRDLEEARSAYVVDVVSEAVDERDRCVAAGERQQYVGLRSIGTEVRVALVDRHRGDAPDVVVARERRFREELGVPVQVVREATE